jgi:hypothetical protein
MSKEILRAPVCYEWRQRPTDRRLRVTARDGCKSRCAHKGCD